MGTRPEEGSVSSSVPSLNPLSGRPFSVRPYLRSGPVYVEDGPSLPSSSPESPVPYGPTPTSVGALPSLERVLTVVSISVDRPKERNVGTLTDSSTPVSLRGPDPDDTQDV